MAPAAASKPRAVKPKPKPTPAKKVAPVHTHAATPEEFHRTWVAHKGRHLMIFVFSDTCPYCVLVKPTWRKFVDSSPKVSTASVESAVFDACVRGKGCPVVDYQTIPFICMTKGKKGKVHRFDDFLKAHAKGAEGRTVANLKRFAKTAA